VVWGLLGEEGFKASAFGQLRGDCDIMFQCYQRRWTKTEDSSFREVGLLYFFQDFSKFYVQRFNLGIQLRN